MNRREFLKLSPLVLSTLFVGFSPLGKASNRSVQLRVGNRMFQGTSDGEVFTSRDSGTTWKLHTYFGSGIAITNLVADIKGRVIARAEYSGYPFHLLLSDDGSHWMTV